jgi:SMC interacting uncharacterized protein involved in chromosome segregation
MKTINVSEDALNTIKRMAEEREQEIEILRESIRAIRDIAQNQDIGKAWVTVQNLCNQALLG